MLTVVAAVLAWDMVLDGAEARETLDARSSTVDAASERGCLLLGTPVSRTLRSCMRLEKDMLMAGDGVWSGRCCRRGIGLGGEIG